MSDKNEELDLLKQQADKLGITYRDNIGIETLKNRIAAKLEGGEQQEEQEEEEEQEEQKPASNNKKEKESEQQVRDRLRKEMLKLVRVRITCMNPLKAQLPGEIFTVANKYLGTVRKFIPYGEATDNGYHVPKILLDELKSRKFNSVQTKKGDKGAVQLQQRLVPEFSIEELPPLTKEELAKLAASQTAAAGL